MVDGRDGSARPSSIQDDDDHTVVRSITADMLTGDLLAEVAAEGGAKTAAPPAAGARAVDSDYPGRGEREDRTVMRDVTPAMLKSVPPPARDGGDDDDDGDRDSNPDATRVAALPEDLLSSLRNEVAQSQANSHAPQAGSRTTAPPPPGLSPPRPSSPSGRTAPPLPSSVSTRVPPPATAVVTGTSPSLGSAAAAALPSATPKSDPRPRLPSLSELAVVASQRGSQAAEELLAYGGTRSPEPAPEVAPPAPAAAPKVDVVADPGQSAGRRLAVQAAAVAVMCSLGYVVGYLILR